MYKLCAFPVGHIPIPDEDESQWNKHTHRERRLASPGMHILTGNGDVPRRECTFSLEMGMCLTGIAQSLYRLTWTV